MNTKIRQLASEILLKFGPQGRTELDAEKFSNLILANLWLAASMIDAACDGAKSTPRVRIHDFKLALDSFAAVCNLRLVEHDINHSFEILNTKNLE